MPWKILVKILEDLDAWEFDGFIEFYGINEPLIHPRYEKELILVRERLSRATVFFTSNGDALGKNVDRAVAKLVKMYEAGANIINLNSYDSGRAGIERLAFYHRVGEALETFAGVQLTRSKYKRTSTRARRLAITDMTPETLALRASSGKRGADIVYQKTNEDRDQVRPSTVVGYCGRPHRHLFIDYSGDVLLCCAVDPTQPRSGSFGNIKKQTLQEIWDNERLWQYRYFLQDARRVLPDCSTCAERHAYAHIVRRVTASAETLQRWENEQ
jgi:radical SAM protein with 4Fe4S-binding SPASM domain